MIAANTVFIVDDDTAMADAISWLLKTIHLPSRIFTSAEAFLADYDVTWSGCLLIDIRMPGMSGLVLQEKLNQQNNKLPIIFLTGHGDVPMAVRALQAGAMDFILKPFNDQILLDKIQNALAQNHKQTDVVKLQQKFLLLTAREVQVFNLIVLGKLNKQIAHELNIALSTVEMHRGKVMEKMQAESLAELIKMYFLLNPLA